jgi:Iap family predicted aminopeptidase
MTTMGSEASVVGNIWSSGESYRNFLDLCDGAGGRFCGTRGEREARDFIAGKLAEYGLLEVHLEPVDHLIWRRGRTELEITEPKRRSIGSLALAYSSPTHHEGIETELVILPEPTAQAFDESGKEIEGKAVLTDIGRGVGPACQSTQWAAAGGADALILMANAYGSMQPAGSCRWNQDCPIPVVSISREDGEYLRRLAQKGRVSVRCLVECRTEPGRSHNVVGDVPGKGSPEEQVIIGAHYDGFDLAQSAIDNASGTATVMEAARALSAKAECPHTIRFVLFAAEELGMVGSLGYVNAHASEMKDVSAMLTTDWPGSPAGYGVQLPFTDLQDHIRNLAETGTRVSSGLGMYSDHFPFMLEGVPVMWVGGSITGRDLEIYHTVFDTADKVPPRVMKESAMLMARAAMDLADPGSWTPGHRTRQEIVNYLEREGRRPELEAEGRWREGAVEW